MDKILNSLIKLYNSIAREPVKNFDVVLEKINSMKVTELMLKGNKLKEKKNL